MIGGDMSQAGERHGVCNGQMAYILRDDPERFTTTRGYLWGLYAYLVGHDEGWLRLNKPECAGSAVYALNAALKPGEPTPLRRWLVASMLKATKIWCQGLAEKKHHDTIGWHPKDLPDMLEALSRSEG